MDYVQQLVVEEDTSDGVELFNGLSILQQLVWGHSLPWICFEFRYSEVAPEATFVPKLHCKNNFATTIVHDYPSLHKLM